MKAVVFMGLVICVSTMGWSRVNSGSPLSDLLRVFPYGQ